MKRKKLELDQNNYYSPEANQQYFSVSQYKDFMKCEAMAMAKINGTYQPAMTKAMLTGSFVDAYFEGTLDAFMKSIRRSSPESRNFVASSARQTRS